MMRKIYNYSMLVMWTIIVFFINQQAMADRIETDKVLDSSQSVSISGGNMELLFNPYKLRNNRSGIACFYNGEEFSLGSGFGACSYDWRKSYCSFSHSDDFKLLRGGTDDSRNLMFRINSSNANGFVKYSILSGNILDISCHIKLENKGGRVTFDLFRIAPSIIQGLPLQVQQIDGNKVSLCFAVSQKTNKRVIVTDRFKSLSILSRLGPIKIKVLEKTNLSLQVADWRGRGWPGMPYFFLGVNGEVVRAGQTGTVRLQVQFPPVPKKPSDTVLRIAKSKWIKRQVVTPVTDIHPQITPTPKKLMWGKGRFTLSPETPVIFKNVADRDKKKLFIALNDIIKRRFQFQLNSKNISGKHSIELVIDWSKRDKGDEYYELLTTPEKTVIRANRPSGLMYGIQTMRQLLWQDPAAPGVICADIKDWPSLAMRGVHCFSGKDAAALQCKFAKDIWSAGKFNYIVYECGYVKWDSTPLAHSDKLGMDKADAVTVAEAMRANYLEPIPLIQSLGHIDWLNRNVLDKSAPAGAHTPRAYGEYMAAGSTYATCLNPLNRDGQKLLEKVYDEAIEIFHPKYFHLGFDECFAALEGLAKSSGISPEKLFIKQLLDLQNYLKQKNIRTMIWGDILLSDKEGPDYTHAPSSKAAEEMRQAIPKDIIIADWHYGNFKPGKYVDIDVLQNAGFEVLGSSAYFPENIIWFTRALKQKQSQGYLITTWAGFSFDQDGFDHGYSSYYAYILAAEAAWNGGYAALTEIPFRTDRKFVEFWTKDDFSRFMVSGAKTWAVDLSEAVNLPLSGKGNWFGMSSDHSLGVIDKTLSNDVKFNFMKNDGGVIDQALLLDAGFNPSGHWPGKVIVDVDKKLDTLVFAQAASFKGKRDVEIARYIITYKDGTTHEIPLRYGRNIFWYSDTRNKEIWDNHNNPLLWTGENQTGEEVSIRYLKIDNPYPGKVISTVSAESCNEGPGLILFGIAGFANQNQSL